MSIFNKNFLLGCGAGILLLIAIFFGGSYLFLRSYMSGNEMEAMLPPPPFPSQEQADLNWKVLDLNGRTLNLAELKGRVIFLNFWATWCPACVAEMPNIERLYNGLKDEGVVFFAVSEEDSHTITEFAKKEKLTLPLCSVVGKLPDVFKTGSIPATFILSPEGKIAFRHIGSARWDDPASFAFIRGLLSQKPPGE